MQKPLSQNLCYIDDKKYKIFIWHNGCSVLSPFTECYNEADFHYPGNDLNQGFDNRQSDGEACRLSCRSITGAKFFDWVSPEFHDQQYHNGCWCKTSDAGRTPNVGITCGNVNCLYATGKKVLSFQIF